MSPIASMQAVQARIAAIESVAGGGRPASVGAPAARARAGAGTAAGAAPANATSFEELLASLKAPGADGLGLGGAAAAGVGGPDRAAPAPGAGGVTGDKVIETAKKYLGVPYLWGGTTAKGFDCSGLVQKVYGELGIELPRVSRDQARAGRPVANISEARPGDLVAFNSPVSHIGIYIGDGKMINAPRRGQAVKVQELWGTPTAIRRVLPEQGVQAAGAARAIAPVAATARAGSSAFAHLFAAAGARHGVDPALLSAVAKAESGYDPRAVSPAGARGLMQIMPATARGLGVDPMVPEQAVDGAARLLASHLQKYDGSIELALAAYNAGPGNVAKYGGVPPFKETRGYIQKVLTDLGGRP